MGIDHCEVERVARTLERFGERFLRRVFTEEEVRYCLRFSSPAERLAARFAAKEATAKALGTGLSHGVGWKMIEVRREKGKEPRLYLSGRAAVIACERGIMRWHLAITHAGGLATAIVIGEGGWNSGSEREPAAKSEEEPTAGS
ncbi:MAG: holo-[acyl-carrier-protein] synthase [Candidatus Hydrogenedentota bacterium]|nr:MAG: holo-[acyl-carrier-protein] synthase [Candidatus Hydrogenedentota bacterium]